MEVKQDISFDKVIFTKVLIYHMLNSFILGPFTTIVVILCGDNRMWFNMGFLGWHLDVFLQLYLYLFFLMDVVLQAALTEKDDTVAKKTELLAFCIAIFMRNIFISTKYATMSPEKLQYFRTRFATFKEREKESAVFGWRRQPEGVIDEELTNSIYRSEVDLSTFYLSFRRPLRPELIEAVNTSEVKNLADLEADLVEDFNKDHTLSGWHLAKYLLSNSRKNSSKTTFIYMAFPLVLATVKAFIPCLTQRSMGESYFGDSFEKLGRSINLIGIEYSDFHYKLQIARSHVL